MRQRVKKIEVLQRISRPVYRNVDLNQPSPQIIAFGIEPHGLLQRPDRLIVLLQIGQIDAEFSQHLNFVGIIVADQPQIHAIVPQGLVGFLLLPGVLGQPQKNARAPLYLHLADDVCADRQHHDAGEQQDGATCIQSSHQQFSTSVSLSTEIPRSHWRINSF